MRKLDDFEKVLLFMFVKDTGTLPEWAHNREENVLAALLDWDEERINTAFAECRRQGLIEERINLN
ncbi:MAG TPA: hypothetical protein VFD70_30865 [Anaerolineae bacterium]|nr:hypothetical protein [Anaerolineae bacterium]